MYEMGIKYSNVFQFKALPDMQNLVFFVCKSYGIPVWILVSVGEKCDFFPCGNSRRFNQGLRNPRRRCDKRDSLFCHEMDHSYSHLKTRMAGSSMLFF
jgi:hypothetical protein